MTAILESALRTYRLIASADELSKTQSRAMRRKFDTWLRERAIPALEEYWARPRFRKEATWVQRAFGPDRSTAEWVLIQDLADALRTSARDVLAIASAAAQDGDFPTMEAAHATLSESADEPNSDNSVANRELRRLRLLRIDTALALHQCQSIQTRRAEDLVNPEDYFGPYRDSVVVIDGKSVSVGQLLPFVNPRQKIVGNHVVRALLTRVTTDRDSLDRVRRPAYQQIRRDRRRRLVEREQRSWTRLSELIGRVDYEYLTCTDARIREGCMVLVQVYRDFAPSSIELDWLRLSPTALAHGRGFVRAELQMRADFDTSERLHVALDEVRQLYSDSQPGEVVIDEAISLGGLVLVESKLEAYWEGERIDVEWYRARKPWEMLWLLALHGKAKHAVGADELYPESSPGSRSTMPNRWSRLKEVLPPSLHRLVVPAQKETYLLDLPAHRISLFPS